MQSVLKDLDIKVDQIIKHKLTNRYFAVSSISIKHPDGGIHVQYVSVEVSQLNHHRKPVGFSLSTEETFTRSSTLEFVRAEFELTKFRVDHEWAIAYLDDHGYRCLMTTGKISKVTAQQIAKDNEGVVAGYLIKA